MSTRQKKANGLGGVTKHKAAGGYIVRLTVDGQRITRYAKTQAEGEFTLNELRRKAGAGIDMRADRMTVAEYLSRWLEDVARLKVRPRTLEGYGQHVRDHLAPALGRHKLSELRSGHVQRMIKDKTAAGLSAGTVQRIRATLRAALADAEAKAMITRNPARFVDLPKVERLPIEAIEPERAAAILEAVKGHRLESLIILAMYTGMRQGELLGLSWRAVDLAAGRLTVMQALSRRTGGPPVLAEPKTKRSRRTLALPAAAVEALKAHRERQRFEAQRLGDAWQNAAGLVFVAEHGGPLEPSVSVSALHRCLDTAGLPRMRFHDLRHAYATLALQSGAGLRDVMEGLGHSDIGTTGNLYAHVAPSTMRRMADGLETMIVRAGQGDRKG